MKIKPLPPPKKKQYRRIRRVHGGFVVIEQNEKKLQGLRKNVPKVFVDRQIESIIAETTRVDRHKTLG